MIRDAKISEAKVIQSLVNAYAKKGEMLSLSLNDIYEKIFEFMLFEENGEVLGCCAIHPSWEDLAEVRSLAVREDAFGRGIGRALVESAINKAREFGIKNVFALTYKPEFFQKMGFREIKKENLPKKIWSDCLKCPMFPDCDEIAVIKENIL